MNLQKSPLYLVLAAVLVISVLNQSTIAAPPIQTKRSETPDPYFNPRSEIAKQTKTNLQIPSLPTTGWQPPSTTKSGPATGLETAGNSKSTTQPTPNTTIIRESQLQPNQPTKRFVPEVKQVNNVVTGNEFSPGDFAPMATQSSSIDPAAEFSMGFGGATTNADSSLTGSENSFAPPSGGFGSTAQPFATDANSFSALKPNAAPDTGNAGAKLDLLGPLEAEPDQRLSDSAFPNELPQPETTPTQTSVGNSSVTTATPESAYTAFEPSQVLAMVGTEPIFVGDLLFEVNQLLEQYMPGCLNLSANRNGKI